MTMSMEKEIETRVFVSITRYDGETMTRNEPQKTPTTIAEAIAWLASQEV